MHCPYCNTVNDDENSFCVSCGKTISQDYKTLPNALPPTQIYRSEQSNEPDSVQTAYPPKPVFNQPQPNFNQPFSYQETPQKSGKGLLIAVLGIGILIILGAIGAGGYYFWQQQQTSPQTAEVLPDHLGMFVQNKDKTTVTEIKQKDVTNVLDEKESLLKDDSLSVWEENSSVILYSDAKEVPVTDLKLIQLDTIEDDGNLKQIDFQAAPIDGKPEMKRLRFPNGIAKGKYAFALFNGFLNEGTHKFWAFQVKDSKKSDNNDIAKSANISVKDLKDSKKSDDKEKTKDSDETAKKETVPPPPPKKDTKVPPPSGARVAYSNGSDVLLRSTPSLNGKKIGKLSRGQRIYIIYYSENYDEWRGTTANWAYIQTESGGRGWVFSPFVYY
jgi:cytoskeletal protein RodZ